MRGSAAVALTRERRMKNDRVAHSTCNRAFDAHADASEPRRRSACEVRFAHPHRPLRDQPSGQHRRAPRARCTRWVSSRLVLVDPQRFPDPEADALASGATRCARVRRSVVATLDEALAGAALAIGFSARPREFAGARAAGARRGAGGAALTRPRARSRSCSAPRCRGCRMPSSRAARSWRRFRPIRRSHRSISRRRCRSPRTNCASPRAATRCGRAPAFEPATQDEIARLFAHGERTLIALDFLRPAHPKRLLPRLRRLFARARLEKEEVNILRGILARIDERLGRRTQARIEWRRRSNHQPMRDRRRRHPAATAARRLDGAYCPHCGQETKLRLPTLREFVREAAGRYVAFDGRFWRTVFALLLRPGFLTREYFAGPPSALHPSGAAVPVRDADIFRRVAPVRRAGQLSGCHRRSRRSQVPGARRIASPNRQAPADEDRFEFPDRARTTTGHCRMALQAAVEPFPASCRSSEKAEQLVDGHAALRAVRDVRRCCRRSRCCSSSSYLGRRRRYPRRPRLYGEHLVFAAHDPRVRVRRGDGRCCWSGAARWRSTIGVWIVAIVYLSVVDARASTAARGSGCCCALVLRRVPIRHLGRPGDRRPGGRRRDSAALNSDSLVAGRSILE